MKKRPIAPGEMTVAYRVECADSALRHHFDIREDEVRFEDEQEAPLVDLLADLRHWADAKGFDFFAALDTSYLHYLREKKGA